MEAVCVELFDHTHPTFLDSCTRTVTPLRVVIFDYSRGCLFVLLYLGVLREQMIPYRAAAATVIILECQASHRAT
jgi:hypothetical protein